MTFFFLCCLLLIAGYFTYGWLVERIFGIEPGRKTPAYEMQDHVDYMPLPTWKVFFIQLLDIAGLGPIFGPILGALYGPVALLWIVLGTILAGGVHDFFSGMLSLRNRGQSIPEVVGDFLGMPARQLMRIVSVTLLLLVGVVFVLGPAKLLASMLPVHEISFISGMLPEGWNAEQTGSFDTMSFIVIIFLYYFAATILPIDKIIGWLYPIFGALLLFMTFGVMIGLMVSGRELLPSLDFTTNTHPEGKPIWPLLFITLSCGALSGFHSTQSPLMARCLKTERHGRHVFYGAMVAEGIIALVWAAVGLSFYESPEAMDAVIKEGSPSLVVKQVCTTLLGVVGGFFAVMGVIVLPITSGDTAFRSVRLILAESFGVKQRHISRRLLLAVPLFLLAIWICTVDFKIIWRYFGFTNQLLAMLTLWAASVYLLRNNKPHWIASLPAVFMTAVCVSFILQAQIGFGLDPFIANAAGWILALAGLAILLLKGKAGPTALPPQTDAHASYADVSRKRP